MDIKLKSFSRNKVLQRVAFFLCVISFLVSLMGLAFIFNEGSTSYYGNGIDDLLLYNSYEESAAFQTEYNDKLDRILEMLDHYKSEEYIKSGNTITEQRMEDATRSLFYNKVYDEYSENIVTITGEYPTEKYGGNYDVPAVRERFKQDYADKIAELKQALIMDELHDFQRYQKELTEQDGFVYYATDGVDTVTNMPGMTNTPTAAVDVKQFTSASAYLIYQDATLTKVPDSDKGNNSFMKNFDKYLQDRLDDKEYEHGFKVYFSFDDNYLKAKETEFGRARGELMQWMPLALGGALVSLILLIYLIVVTGRKDTNGTVRVYKVDRIFTEFQLLAIGILFAGGGVLFGNFLLETVNYGVNFYGEIYYSNNLLSLSIALAVIIGLFSASFGLYFILSVVRNIKAGRFFKNSLICMAVSFVWNGLKALYQGGSLMKKVVLITLAICLLSATVVLAPFVAALIIVLAPKWVRKYEDVEKGVNEVKNGNLAYKIPADGDSELDGLARGINEISEASNRAIQNELKNQRMKTDLISNVSHDLKTPLTSIITYIDLLKQEGLDHPEAPKYLEILDQKSIRLKKLTEDLFDAAKASSGAIPVKFEKVDMLSLINQGLGEMSDKIENSNLVFKINAQKENYYVRADGQLLWRVVENLLVNVLKYAQEGSRVYIDLKEQNSNSGKNLNVILEIKNISKTELNVEADELIERFKRGEESRTTEGSGLGLAIAKDLVRLQNGWFEIKIDGDLFKAIVMLESYAAGNEKE